MRTKFRQFSVKKFLCEKKLNSVKLSSHFACEITIWPIKMQLMTHYRIPEMTESLVGKASNCFDSELASIVLIQNWPGQFSSEKIFQEYFTQSGN